MSNDVRNCKKHTTRNVPQPFSPHSVLPKVEKSLLNVTVIGNLAKGPERKVNVAVGSVGHCQVEEI